MAHRGALVMKSLSRTSALAATILSCVAVWRLWNGESDAERLGARRISPDTSFTMQGVRLGSASAKVVVAVFADYECPYCASFNLSLGKLRAALGDTLAIVFRQFPLVASHPNAEKSALVALCAARQGRFIAMNDTLFAWRSMIGQRSWSDFAVAAGIKDLPQLENCIDGSEARALLNLDLSAASRLGVQVTPSLLVGDLLVQGEISVDSVRSLVVAEGKRVVPTKPEGMLEWRAVKAWFARRSIGRR